MSVRISSFGEAIFENVDFFVSATHKETEIAVHVRGRMAVTLCPNCYDRNTRLPSSLDVLI